jgi:hypothetical protein
METEPDLPVKRVNGRMWQLGESGNSVGRPICQRTSKKEATREPGGNRVA